MPGADELDMRGQEASVFPFRPSALSVHGDTEQQLMSLENISSATVDYSVSFFYFIFFTFFFLFFLLETLLPDKAARETLRPRLRMESRMSRFVQLQKNATACCTLITCADVPLTKISSM